MNNVWNNHGSDFIMSEITNQVPILPKGIYKLNRNPMTGQFYVTRISDKFKFDYKVYGTETSFIDHVVKTWNNTTANMGVLLNGVKGTGKTVTAEQISNTVDLPVIIIPTAYENITNFLNELNQDVVVFIDEYDKIFERYNNSLLTVMDGVLKTDTRILFLLTSNNDYLEANMKQRPSRVRYIKQFGNMTLETIIEIVDDLLVHKHRRLEVIKAISSLSLITMDLVKSIIQEVNIHDAAPESFMPFMNVNEENEEKYYNLYMIGPDKKPVTVFENKHMPDRITDQNLGKYIAVRMPEYTLIGALSEILPDGSFTMKYHDGNPLIMKALGKKVDSNYEKNYDVEEFEENAKGQFILEEVKKVHNAFYGYAF
jgi:cytidylate kinase